MSSESELSNSSTLSPKQRPSSKSQKASLTRIVKAQVTLLISNLNNDNFTRKSTEIRNVRLKKSRECIKLVYWFDIFSWLKHMVRTLANIYFVIFYQIFTNFAWFKTETLLNCDCWKRMPSLLRRTSANRKFWSHLLQLWNNFASQMSRLKWICWICWIDLNWTRLTNWWCVSLYFPVSRKK